MSMKTIVVVASALVTSATLSAQAQKPQPAQRVQSPKPAAVPQGNPASVPADFKRLKLDFSLFGTPLEGKVVKGAPYSAELVTESVQTLGDGNRIVHRSTSRVYRDTEGRVRREDDRGTANPSVTINDPVANRSYTLDAGTRTARETPGLRWLSSYFTAFQGARMTLGYTPLTWTEGAKQGDSIVTIGRGGRGSRPREGGNDYLEEQLPNRTIEGVVASGVRRTTTIPQGAIGNEQPIKVVSEEWTSVDLQVLVLTEVNDPRSGHSTYRLSNINRSEPDPALFKVPADYTVVPAGGRGRGGR